MIVDKHATTKEWPMWSVEGYIESSLKGAMQAYFDGFLGGRRSWVVMDAQRCRIAAPTTVLETTRQLVEHLVDYLPESLAEAGWVVRGREIPPVPDKYQPGLVRALLPYVENEGAGYLVEYGSWIKLTRHDWETYTGIRVGSYGGVL